MPFFGRFLGGFLAFFGQFLGGFPASVLLSKDERLPCCVFCRLKSGWVPSVSTVPKEGLGCRVISKLLLSDFQAPLSSGCSTLPNPQAL
jgi:hypothetical protein